jgi:hypothetical protein
LHFSSGDQAAYQPDTATTKRRWMIGVIVTSCVNHQRLAAQLCQRKSRCQNGLLRFAGPIDIEGGQIALVHVILPRDTVTSGLQRIIVATSPSARYSFTILHAAVAAAIGMHMKAVQACRQRCQRRGENYTVTILGQLDLTHNGTTRQILHRHCRRFGASALALASNTADSIILPNL